MQNDKDDVARDWFKKQDPVKDLPMDDGQEDLEWDDDRSIWDF